MQYIDFHTHKLPSDAFIFSIVNWTFKDAFDDNISYSIGIHPWSTHKVNKNHLEAIKQYAESAEVIAIGECGLDKLQGADLKKQLEVFHFHIELSETLGKPLIIHCVKAYSEVIKIRKDLKPQQDWILHGFNSSIETMNQALNAGFYLSYGPHILNPKSRAHNAFLKTPLDKLLLETDDSGISIIDLYNQAAEYLSISLEKLSQQQNANYNIIFN